MTFAGGPLDRTESDGMLARMVAHWHAQGFGRAAVTRKETHDPVGFAGLGSHPATPGEIEIGWRLASRWWGRGYATEAATAMRDLAHHGQVLTVWELARPL